MKIICDRIITEKRKYVNKKESGEECGGEVVLVDHKDKGYKVVCLECEDERWLPPNCGYFCNKVIGEDNKGLFGKTTIKSRFKLRRS
jgi:hypothetical protein